ncbi:hypothetical protein VHEMI06144 [[Torrubiella] hemipterigena]|uniref:2EXR domain-containing protein n=1 Tax=[Torrubiella] hemipterigena TaxID=1531966 RepID=A0A0A1TIQ6_9HYPO|nr:hypothetical protein VHEMI06144 [[Torrubiella] hemipterigena]
MAREKDSPEKRARGERMAPTKPQLQQYIYDQHKFRSMAIRPPNQPAVQVHGSSTEDTAVDATVESSAASANAVVGFPLLTQLPVELQSIIWKAAIPVARPTAYEIIPIIQPIHYNEDGTVNRDNLLWRVHFYNATYNGRSSNDHITTLSSLLLCCHQASKIAIAAYQYSQPELPISIRDLRHKIDGGSDLVIVRAGWQLACSHGPYMWHNMERSTELHALGFHWPGPEQVEKFWPCERICRRALWLWHGLRIFYIVVDPKYLNPKPWDPNEERFWGEDDDSDGPGQIAPFVENYRQDYERGERRFFYVGGRQYFEVPTEVVAEAGDLEEVAEAITMARRFLNEWHEYNTDSSFISCLVLSWKDA